MKIRVALFILLFVTLAAALTRYRSIQLVNSTIDSTPIGQSAPSTGGFTSLRLNGSTYTQLQSLKSVSMCTTGGSSYDNCSNTVFWPTPFADASYMVTCSGVAPGEVGTGNDAPTLNMVSYNSNSVTLITQTQRSQTAHYTEAHCIGVHP